jgi:hypothetical protein
VRWIYHQQDARLLFCKEMDEVSVDRRLLVMMGQHALSENR